MKTEQLRIKLFAFMCMVLSSSVFANGGGGLTEAKSWIDSQTGIIYAILTILASGYVMYLVGMAFFNKMQWADVLLGIAKVALGGGLIAIAATAWTYFGTYNAG